MRDDLTQLRDGLRRRCDVGRRRRRRRRDFDDFAPDLRDAVLEPVNDDVVVFRLPHRLLDIVTLRRLRRHGSELVLKGRELLSQARTRLELGLKLLEPVMEVFLYLQLEVGVIGKLRCIARLYIDERRQRNQQNKFQFCHF